MSDAEVSPQAIPVSDIRTRGGSRVLAIGAINASDSGNDNIEPFSSHGPVGINFPSLEIREKLDLTGIDGDQSQEQAVCPTSSLAHLPQLLTLLASPLFARY